MSNTIDRAIKTRENVDLTRYTFDFGYCRVDYGWCSIDTDQDA